MIIDIVSLTQLGESYLYDKPRNRKADILIYGQGEGTYYLILKKKIDPYKVLEIVDDFPQVNTVSISSVQESSVTILTVLLNSWLYDHSNFSAELFRTLLDKYINKKK